MTTTQTMLMDAAVAVLLSQDGTVPNHTVKSLLAQAQRVLKENLKLNQDPTIALTVQSIQTRQQAAIL